MMKAFALLLLLPALALAQPVPPSGNCGSVSAACRASQFSLIAGNQLCLNSTTCTTWVQASVATGGMRLNSGVANSGGNAAYSFDTTNALSGSTLILNIGSGGVQKLSVDNAGKIRGTFATPQFIDLSFGANGVKIATGSVSGGDVYITDQAGNAFLHSSNGALTVGSQENPVPQVHAAQTTSPVAMEFGRAAASAGGVLAVTFATAFASAPTCVCTDENAVPVICGITTAPITTAVTFSITAARADTIDWYCIGAK